ncbi:MAG TPA: hypothetical protein VNF29_05620 [Candidatus Binataceae bacterium]|nr:hypothetical protein [Candidatus Binataceae bacterium]
MANAGTKKPTARETEARIAELERKLAELSEQARVLDAHVHEHEARLDERIQKIANLIATTQAGRL